MPVKKDTQKTIKPKMSYIKVLYSQSTNVVKEADPTDEWDADDVSHSYSFQGYEIVNKAEYDTEPVPFIPEENQPLFAVIVRYSTGDSFHREDGCMEVVCICQYKTDAEYVRNAMNIWQKKTSKNDKASMKSWSIKLPKAGHVVEVHPSTWMGWDILNRLNQ